MNKPFYIFLFFILFCCEAKTQTEYITNGSFEDTDSCCGNYAPIGLDVFEWSGCKGWSNPIASSSDLWCFGGKLGIEHPPNVGGLYQYARSGNNYAGIFIGFQSFYNYREYIQTQLNQQLSLGKYYEINFYLSSNAGSCNISEIGVKFYNAKLKDLSKFQLTKLFGNIEADVTNEKTNFIKDTLGWQKITLNYKATGTESYMIIGCFIDSLNLVCDYSCDTTGWISQIFPGDYMFLDDVSIIEAPFKEPIFPNVFSPNNDEINDNWYLDLTGYENISYSLYNRWGNKIYQTSNSIIKWDGRTTSGVPCNDGAYFYSLEATNPYKEKKQYKGFIQLIR